MLYPEFKILLEQRLCDLADVLLQYHNPCQLGNNRCLITDDITQGDLHCCYHHGSGGTSCQNLRNSLCENRNINCKLWLCATAISRNPECTEDLKDLENLAKRYGLTRRPYLGERYYGKGAELAAVRARESM